MDCLLYTSRCVSETGAKWAESETLSSTGNITEMMMELGF